ncbi:MAG TPA: type I-B CRISPR-associated protein Cas5b [Vicinamibacterales bacterium]|nr:type I-B CRISPR-associated protein Cas5b [Vicinamibacterales bacterium]
MARRFVIFDVASEMAHFRRQYAITTALTYPVPPRTALCGLIGAILGLPKNESLRQFSDEDAVFGLQVLTPLRTGHVSINLVDTKDNSTFRLKAVNPRTTMRYEVVRAPRYRVMFSHGELVDQLRRALENGESVYTPCLGLAWMMAWFEGRPIVLDGEEIRDEGTTPSIVSPVRSDDLRGSIRWNPDGVYQRVRMPAEMRPDRQVTRYESYVIDATGRAISAALRVYWKLSDGTCFSAM